MKNFVIFKQLCGEEYSTIVLTTTMWDEVDLEIGEQREKELRENYGKPMIDRRSTVKRFLSTPASVFDLLRGRVNEIQSRRSQSPRNQTQRNGCGPNASHTTRRTRSKEQKLLGSIRDDLLDPKLTPDRLEGLMRDIRRCREGSNA